MLKDVDRGCTADSGKVIKEKVHLVNIDGRDNPGTRVPTPYVLLSMMAGKETNRCITRAPFGFICPQP